MLYINKISSAEPIDFAAAELKKYRQEKLDAIPDDITEDVADNWKDYLKVIGIIAGAIIFLILAVVAIKAFFSYNNVR